MAVEMPRTVATTLCREVLAPIQLPTMANNIRRTPLAPNTQSNTLQAHGRPMHTALHLPTTNTTNTNTTILASTVHR